MTIAINTNIIITTVVPVCCQTKFDVPTMHSQLKMKVG
jgi:hypothetical protein